MAEVLLLILHVIYLFVLLNIRLAQEISGGSHEGNRFTL